MHVNTFRFLCFVPFNFSFLNKRMSKNYIYNDTAAITLSRKISVLNGFEWRGKVIDSSLKFYYFIKTFFEDCSSYSVFILI